MNEEEAGLNVDGFAWVHGELIAAIIDFLNQILHLEAVERGDSDEHFVKHDAKRPRVHLLAVASLLEQLRARVQRSSTDRQARVRAVEDR